MLWRASGEGGHQRSEDVGTKRLPAAKRRKQILMSAIRVFARSTYHGATTKAISEEAGVTEALIYRYFGSKRTLFVDAIDHTSSRIVAGLEKILDEHRDAPLEAMQEVFAYYARLLERNEEIAKMIFLVLSELDQPDVRQVYLPYQERALKTFADTIRYWKSKGYVEEDVDTQTAAWLYFGTYLILALVKHSHGTLEIDAAYAVSLARHFINFDVFEDEQAAGE